MTSLFHFEDKVHRRNLTLAESTPNLFSRLLCQVLEHLGFPVEHLLEHRRDCEDVLTIDRWPRLPRAQHLPPQDIAVDHPIEDTEEPQITPPAVAAPFPTSPASPADSCHGRVIGINKICILSSSYCRSQATAL